MIESSDSLPSESQSFVISEVAKRIGFAESSILTELNSLMFINSFLKTKANQFPPVLNRWMASPSFLHFVISQIEKLKPKVILECGSGYSTLVLASYLRSAKGRRPKLISLEESENYAGETQRLLDQFGLSKRVNLHHAPLVSIDSDSGVWFDLSAIRGLGEIGLVIVDGPSSVDAPGARSNARIHLEAAGLTPRLVIADDANRKLDREALTDWGRHVNSEPTFLTTGRGVGILEIPRS